MSFLPRWFVVIAGTVALALWVASFLATIFVPHYKPDPIIGYAAMLVVSACYTAEAIKNVAEKRKQAEETQDRERRDARHKGG